MTASYDFQTAYTRAHKTPRVRVVIGARRLAFTLALSAPLALMPAFAQASSFSPADPCLSFLSSGLTTSGLPGKENQRTAGVTSAAGKAATLSLLLGVRLALGPTEELSRRSDRHTGSAGLSALDVQRYRTCKKEQALRMSALR